MRLPRVRFTLGRMMVAVVIASLVFGAESTRRHLKKLAILYGQRASLHLESAAFAHAMGQETTDEQLVKYLAAVYPNHPPGSPIDKGWIERTRKQLAISARFEDALVAKYQRAARYPWLPVEPDPPEPK